MDACTHHWKIGSDNVGTCGHCGDRKQFEDWFGPSEIKAENKRKAKGRRKAMGVELVCQVCQESFPTPAAFDSHRMGHKRATQKEPSICGICGQSFKRGTALASHMRGSHAKDNGHGEFRETVPTLAADVYKCEVCEDGFSSPTTLAAHMKAHMLQAGQQTTFPPPTTEKCPKPVAKLTEKLPAEPIDESEVVFLRRKVERVMKHMLTLQELLILEWEDRDEQKAEIERLKAKR